MRRKNLTSLRHGGGVERKGWGACAVEDPRPGNLGQATDVWVPSSLFSILVWLFGERKIQEPNKLKDNECTKNDPVTGGQSLPIQRRLWSQKVSGKKQNIQTNKMKDKVLNVQQTLPDWPQTSRCLVVILFFSGSDCTMVGKQLWPINIQCTTVHCPTWTLTIDQPFSVAAKKAEKWELLSLDCHFFRGINKTKKNARELVFKSNFIKLGDIVLEIKMIFILLGVSVLFEGDLK